MHNKTIPTLIHLVKSSHLLPKGEGFFRILTNLPSPSGRGCQALAWRVRVLLASFLLLLAFASFAETINLLRLESSHSFGTDYIDIFTSDYCQPKGILLEKELQITFPGTVVDKSFCKTLVKSNRIAKISVQQIDPQTALVIIKLKKDVEYSLAHIFGQNKTIIEIGDRRDFTAELMAAWEKKALVEKGDPIKAFVFAPQAGTNLPLIGKTIILDPGHGGSDPGAIAPCGQPEKNLTLLTAQKAAKLLSSAGAKVILTRNDDRKNNLRDIVDYVNQTHADIFISIHYNFCSKADISGTETYYYHASSRRLALDLHRSLLYGLKRKDRGLRKQIFYVVHHSQVPAVLLEPLFLSSQSEEKLAFTPDFQEQIAQSIVRGVKDYFRSD